MIGTESRLQYGNLEEDPSGLSHGAGNLKAKVEVSSSSTEQRQISSQQPSCNQTCAEESCVALTRNFAAKMDGEDRFPTFSSYSRQTVESNTYPALMELPMKIVRIPNRRCPVHFQSDQYIFTGLQRNYDTFSVSNCWQGSKLIAASDNASAKATALIAASPISVLQSNSSFIFDPNGTSCCRFLKSIVDFVAWTSIVMICGFIFFYHARGFEY